ncbi:hypothetical protein Moror_11871 [Moniliophthora roreri MCA 2997]|uniref:Uncharacterized protein n=1 Tax=Moniliophthora roreri (strain MCA 2997) TaxID=1381753 RepID=V2X302_MONRO|nr:hypothetical protein Moror_11871 [Moniliophthora roreri MCA 2997]
MSPLMSMKGLGNRALDLSPPTPDFHAKFTPASIPRTLFPSITFESSLFNYWDSFIIFHGRSLETSYICLHPPATAMME